MKQSVGKASFSIPDTWAEDAMFSYTASKGHLEIQVLIGDEIDKSTAEEIIQEKVATMKAVLGSFRIVQDITPIKIANQDGRIVVFDLENGDIIKRYHFAVTMLVKTQAIIITGQAPLDHWTEMEGVWQTFISGFDLHGGLAYRGGDFDG